VHVRPTQLRAFAMVGSSMRLWSAARGPARTASIPTIVWGTGRLHHAGRMNNLHMVPVSASRNLPEGADHVNRLLQLFQALVGLRPAVAEMCSLSASPLPTPRRNRPSSIRRHGVVRRLRDRSDHRPHERAVPLLVAPGVVVIRKSRGPRTRPSPPSEPVQPGRADPVPRTRGNIRSSSGSCCPNPDGCHQPRHG
jgi:hypothetical protein